ncbi:MULTISPECIES: hypothetical protein [unclassified Empedobacter]|uniref:hypothetical protein n=1 Tax=unclassified Empedobacter TaxID=2643773 RepID=UPI0025B9AF86|nr:MULTISPECIES: hypothetical protein [unclassified Empedobacter]
MTNLFQANPNQYFSLIGKSVNDELFQSFQTEFESDISEQNISQGKIVLYKEKGISMKIVDEMIVSIKFYLSPNPICKVYKGLNIFDLNRNIDETQVRKSNDYKRIINNDPNRLANDYCRLNCLFSFDSMTGEFLTIEILNEL